MHFMFYKRKRKNHGDYVYVAVYAIHNNAEAMVTIHRTELKIQVYWTNFVPPESSRKQSKANNGQSTKVILPSASSLTIHMPCSYLLIIFLKAHSQ